MHEFLNYCISQFIIMYFREINSNLILWNLIVNLALPISILCLISL